MDNTCFTELLIQFCFFYPEFNSYLIKYPALRWLYHFSFFFFFVNIVLSRGKMINYSSVWWQTRYTSFLVTLITRYKNCKLSDVYSHPYEGCKF